MVILTVSHNIFLTKDERYALAKKGSAIGVVGASVPMWVKKGITPLPAEEVFCKYVLINSGKPMGVISASDGYTVNVPPIQDKGWKDRVSNETWRKMSEDAKAKWYEKHSGPESIQLLDIADGGSNGYLSFVHRSTIRKINIFHFVIIKPMESLMRSLV
jgi:hypothetical protein